jgi:site-specific DNA-cytosine methylase
MTSPGPGNAAIPTEVARALDTGGVTINQGGTVALQTAVRRLTPVECERVQGFPDDWTRLGLKGDKIVNQKDSPRYRQLGNAVTGVVAVWLAKRVKKYGLV